MWNNIFIDKLDFQQNCMTLSSISKFSLQIT